MQDLIKVQLQTTQYFRFDTADAIQWTIGTKGTDNMTIIDEVNSKTPFTIEQNTATNTLYLDSTGVGIGTATPATALEVTGTGITLGDDVLISFGATPDLTMEWDADGDDRFEVNTAGGIRIDADHLSYNGDQFGVFGGAALSMYFTERIGLYINHTLTNSGVPFWFDISQTVDSGVDGAIVTADISHTGANHTQYAIGFGAVARYSGDESMTESDTGLVGMSAISQDSGDGAVKQIARNGRLACNKQVSEWVPM